MSKLHPAVADKPGVMRTTGWADYALLDSGNGRKLERYGPYSVVRPEPQCLWSPKLGEETWAKADAVFDPTDEEDAGRWRFRGKPRETWPMKWGEVTYNGRFTAFRHLAFFPEQAANWAWLDQRVRAFKGQPKVLNLFGYTGVASLVWGSWRPGRLAGRWHGRFPTPLRCAADPHICRDGESRGVVPDAGDAGRRRSFPPACS